MISSSFDRDRGWRNESLLAQSLIFADQDLTPNSQLPTPNCPLIKDTSCQVVRI
jgi:hypothetical protein